MNHGQLRASRVRLKGLGMGPLTYQMATWAHIFALVLREEIVLIAAFAIVLEGHALAFVRIVVPDQDVNTMGSAVAQTIVPIQHFRCPAPKEPNRDLLHPDSTPLSRGWHPNGTKN